MEVLRCDQEKAKGRLSYLERQLNKAQLEENYKETERKTFGKESKRMQRLVQEAESMKNINKNVGNVHDPTHVVVKSVNDAEGSKMIKAHVLEHSESLSTTIAMDYSDDRDDISRPASSSSGSQHSSIDNLGFTILCCFSF